MKQHTQFVWCGMRKFYPASRVYSLAWLLAFRVVSLCGLFTCKQTSARGCSEILLPFMISDHWRFTCESSGETPCKVYVKIIRELLASQIIDVLPFNEDKYMSKPMWNPMWSVRKNMCETDDIASHPFHIYFTMQNFTCMWNMCVKCMWNECEKHVKRVWKWDIFHTFFTWCFTYILLVVRKITPYAICH